MQAYSRRVTRSLLYLLILALGCKDDEVTPRQYPVIDTREVTDVNSQGAVFNAELLDLGTSGVSDHGFVYHDVPTPTLEFSESISLGSTAAIGSFNAMANTNMIKGTKYYVRAYAVSADKKFTVYGQTVNFISQGSVPPKINDFNPKAASVADTLIVTGSGFSTVKAYNVVNIGTSAAVVAYASPDTLKVLVPATLPLGDQSFGITVGQAHATIDAHFNLLPITLTNVFPLTFSFRDTIIIAGKNFPSAGAEQIASFIEVPGTIIYQTKTILKMIPSDNIKKAKGKFQYAVGSQIVTFTDSVRLTKPVITSVSPGSGTNNTVVTISGNHFTFAIPNIEVKINGTKLNVQSADLSKITVQLPSGIPPGDYPLAVTISGQTVTTTPFKVITPKITTVSPLSGTWGNTITISGENFDPTPSNNQVSFGGVAATIISASNTELKVTVPDLLLSNSSMIAVKVLTVDNQTATFATPFVLSSPVITDFNPKDGKSTTTITITGQNFSNISANNVVTFGDAVAEVVSSTANTLVVKVPKGIEDSNVYVTVKLVGYEVSSSSQFHLISPWRRIADFPSYARAECTAFVIGQSGYVGLGTKNTTFAPPDFFKYDVATNTWSSVANFNFGAGGSGSFTGQASFVISNQGYAGLGSIGYNFPLPNFTHYDPAANTWTSVASTSPNDAVEGGVGYSINGKGYVITGRTTTNGAGATVLQYDPVANTWQKKSSFPGSGRIESAGFTIGNLAYLTTGGNQGGTWFNDLWAYDPSTNQWTQKSSMTGPGRQRATAFSVAGKGYVVGGASGYDAYYNALKDFWTYDPVTNQWTQLENFPGGKRTDAVAFVVGNKAYYGTGLSNPDGYMKDFWEFDPSKL